MPEMSHSGEDHGDAMLVAGGDHFVVFGAVQSLSEVPAVKPRPLLFYRGEYTGIEPDKNTPAQWRDDLESFLTATTPDTWL